MSDPASDQIKRIRQQFENPPAGFPSKAQHIQAVVLACSIGTQTLVAELHRGALVVLKQMPITGPTIRITGSSEDWRPLLDGHVPYIRAAHPVHGTLTVTGDVLWTVWSTPALCSVFTFTNGATTS